MDLNKEAVLRTILYADVFDFPLTEQEVWQFCIASEKIPLESIQRATKSLVSKKVLCQKDGYLALESKEANIRKREENKKYLKSKLLIAEKAALILSQIPSVHFIGLSGSLAVSDVNAQDDIDLFIISDSRYMWVTRALCLILLSKQGMRRTRGKLHERDKICLNMFISENALGFLPDRQDIYTAREIVNVRPLFDRGNLYKRFLDENTWIKTYQPHFTPHQIKNEITTQETSEFHIWYTFPVLQLVEIVQKLHMMPHKTTEQVTASLFAFHPRDYRDEVIRKYRQRLKTHEVSYE